MSLINTKIKPFKNQAFKNGEFIEITEKDTEGRWSVFFFYPADFTFVCPTELGDVADHYEELQKTGRRRIRSIYRYSLHPQSMAQQL